MNRKQRRASGRSGAKPASGGAGAIAPDAMLGELFGAAVAVHRAGAFAEACLLYTSTTARGYITADAREQTAYGTARAYIDVGLNTNDTGSNGASNAFSSNRAFLQWAGITAGLSQSFYDFYNGSAVSFRSGYLPSEDTSSAGWFVWAYTAQLGNGVSATISAEQRRMSQIIGTGAFATAAPIVAAIVNGGTLAGGSLSAGPGYGGMQMPDIVANLRVDQTWGAAQVMGAVHELLSLIHI